VVGHFFVDSSMSFLLDCDRDIRSMSFLLVSSIPMAIAQSVFYLSTFDQCFDRSGSISFFFHRDRSVFCWTAIAID
jgi:hypothetical protein